MMLVLWGALLAAPRWDSDATLGLRAGGATSLTARWDAGWEVGGSLSAGTELYGLAHPAVRWGLDTTLDLRISPMAAAGWTASIGRVELGALALVGAELLWVDAERRVPALPLPLQDQRFAAGFNAGVSPVLRWWWSDHIGLSTRLFVPTLPGGFRYERAWIGLGISVG